MSTETQPEAKPARSRHLLLVLVIVVGVVVGGGAGAFVAAPLLAGKVVAASGDRARDDDAAAAAEEAEAASRRKGGPTVVHVVDNMVLNPANSGGSRFLLLSVGLAVRDQATATMLQERDPELRDVVLRLMGSRTIEQLADVARRDSLKAELRAAVAERFGAAAARDVYFPQFVIQ